MFQKTYGEKDDQAGKGKEGEIVEHEHGVVKADGQHVHKNSHAYGLPPTDDQRNGKIGGPDEGEDGKFLGYGGIHIEFENISAENLIWNQNQRHGDAYQDNRFFDMFIKPEQAARKGRSGRRHDILLGAGRANREIFRKLHAPAASGKYGIIFERF